MLRITLYKNCILNETYQNVISTAIKSGTSVLERYLATLNSYIISDLDNVYYENSRILNFDLELLNGQDIYQYNYMKMQYYDEENNLLLIRYCFINDIRINNEIVLLMYNEDIFSSYSNQIRQLTESYLSRSRKLIYSGKSITLHTLPVNYDGNDLLSKSDISVATQFYVLANVQFYNTEQLGNASKRRYASFLLQYRYYEKVDDNTNIDITTTKMTLNQAISLMNDLVSGQADKTFVATLFGDYNFNGYYQVNNFILFPALNDNIVNSFLNNASAYVRFKQTISEDITTMVYQCNFHRLNEEIKTINVIENTLANNFKRLSIGTFNHQVPIINNGTDINYKIFFEIDDANINIYLNIENQIIEITEDFIYNVPFNSVLGEEVSLQLLSRLTKNIDTFITTAVNVALGAAGIGANIGKIAGLNSKISGYGLRTANNTGIMGTNSDFNKIVKIDSQIDALKSSNMSTAQETLKSGKGINAMIYNNLPLYTTNKGTFAKSSAVFNAKYGIFEYRIDSDNDDFVLKTINNTGYAIYEYCKNLSDIDFSNVAQFVSDNVNYDIIKFDTINIIGNFPRSIALKLNEIFENGFKIWYNENLQEDNLGVR